MQLIALFAVLGVSLTIRNVCHFETLKGNRRSFTAFRMTIVFWLAKDGKATADASTPRQGGCAFRMTIVDVARAFVRRNPGWCESGDLWFTGRTRRDE
jgi:hypothetical protein